MGNFGHRYCQPRLWCVQHGSMKFLTGEIPSFLTFFGIYCIVSPKFSEVINRQITPYCTMQLSSRTCSNSSSDALDFVNIYICNLATIECSNLGGECYIARPKRFCRFPRTRNRFLNDALHVSGRIRYFRIAFPTVKKLCKLNPRIQLR